MEKTTRGLKRLRSGTGKTPTFHCNNCECNRYSPCKCQRSEKKQKPSQEAISDQNVPINESIAETSK